MLPPKLSGYILTLCFNSSARFVSIGPPKVLTIFSKSSHAVLQQIKVFPEIIKETIYNQHKDTLQYKQEINLKMLIQFAQYKKVPSKSFSNTGFTGRSASQAPCWVKTPCLNIYAQCPFVMLLIYAIIAVTSRFRVVISG